MKKLVAVPFVAFFVCALIFSCDSDSDKSFCDVSDPVKELQWLKDTVSEIQASNQDIIVQTGEYKGQQVFTFLICCPVCSGRSFVAPELYNCAGAKIQNADFDKYTYQEKLYSKPDSDCE
jgi:hypothetical protein